MHRLEAPPAVSPMGGRRLSPSRRCVPVASEHTRFLSRPQFGGSLPSCALPQLLELSLIDFMRNELVVRGYVMDIRHQSLG
jgi:hypothetical protein